MLECTLCSCPAELASAFEEQKALCEALNTRNFNLAALNSNLIMRLNTLQSAGGPVALTAPHDSLHLRICLPGGVRGWNPVRCLSCQAEQRLMTLLQDADEPSYRVTDAVGMLVDSRVWVCSSALQRSTP